MKINKISVKLSFGLFITFAVNLISIGQVKINATQSDIPAWFSLPENLSDFWENPNFPANFNLPTNKTAWFEGDLSYKLTANLNQPSVLLKYFNKIAPKSAGHGSQLPKTSAGYDIGDLGYMNIGPTTNIYNNYITNWSKDSVIKKFDKINIGVLNYEYLVNRNDSTTGANAKIFLSSIKNAISSDSKIGLWGIGAISNVKLWFEGSYSSGFDLWRNQYKLDATNLPTSVFFTKPGKDKDLSNPFAYYTDLGGTNNNSGNSGHQIAELIQAIEVSKIHYSNIKVLPSLWWEEEQVSNNNTSRNQTRIDFKTNERLPNGKNYSSSKYKRVAPPNYMYNTALWSLCIADGYHHWGTGANLSTNVDTGDDLYYPSPAPVENGPNLRRPLKIEIVNGLEVPTIYTPKYAGLYNYVVLANWQVSQSPYKEIIENTTTAWEMPDFGLNETITQTLDNKFPSYCIQNKSPLIRFKYGPGTLGNRKVIFVASHEYQDPFKTSAWSFKDPANNLWIAKIELKGNMATIGFIQENYTISPLSIKMSTIDLNCLTDESIISWSVYEQNDIEAFQIEGSKDAIKWEKFSDVKNLIEKNFQIKIDNEIGGRFQYFRIGAINKNNNIEKYSNIIYNTCFNNNLDIFIYPSPFKDKIIIENKQSIIISKIEIFDVSGKKFINKKIDLNSETNQEISLNELPSGIYFVNIYDKNDILLKIKKIIK